LQEIAKKEHNEFNSILITNNLETQQNGMHPYDTFCIICKGKVVLYKPEIKSDIIEILQQNK